MCMSSWTGGIYQAKTSNLWQVCPVNKVWVIWLKTLVQANISAESKEKKKYENVLAQCVLASFFFTEKPDQVSCRATDWHHFSSHISTWTFSSPDWTNAPTGLLVMAYDFHNRCIVHGSHLAMWLNPSLNIHKNLYLNEFVAKKYATQLLNPLHFLTPFLFTKFREGVSHYSSHRLLIGCDTYLS